MKTSDDEPVQVHRGTEVNGDGCNVGDIVLTVKCKLRSLHSANDKRKIKNVHFIVRSRENLSILIMNIPKVRTSSTRLFNIPFGAE